MCLRYPETSVRTDVSIFHTEWRDIRISGKIEKRLDSIKIKATMDNGYERYKNLIIYWNENTISFNNELLNKFFKPKIMSLKTFLIDVDEDRFPGTDTIEIRFRFQEFHDDESKKVRAIEGMQNKYINYSLPEAVINLTQDKIQNVRIYYQDRYCQFHSRIIYSAAK